MSEVKQEVWRLHYGLMGQQLRQIQYGSWDECRVALVAVCNALYFEEVGLPELQPGYELHTLRSHGDHWQMALVRDDTFIPVFPENYNFKAAPDFIKEAREVMGEEAWRELRAWAARATYWNPGEGGRRIVAKGWDYKPPVDWQSDKTRQLLMAITLQFPSAGDMRGGLLIQEVTTRWEGTKIEVSTHT